MKILSLLLLVVCNISYAQLSDSFIVNRIDDQSDLSFLKSAIGDSRVVLLGEHSHGEGNEFEMKAKLIAYLHEEMGFNIIAFESGLYDLWKANEAMEKGEPVESALRKSLFPIWMLSEQFSSTVDYLEAHRSEFVLAGFDSQLTGDFSETMMVDELRDILALSKSLPDEGDLQSFDQVVQSISKFSLPYAFDISAFEKMMLRLRTSLNAVPSMTISEGELSMWIQNLTSLTAYVIDVAENDINNITEAKWKSVDSNGRDLQMAKNLSWLTKQYPDEKIICWGATFHFANKVQILNDDELTSSFPMGYHLKKELGDENVYSLGFITGGGEYGAVYEQPNKVPELDSLSIEYQLSLQKYQTAFVDYKQFEGVDFVSSMIGYEPIKGQWSEVVDGVIYLDEVSPSTEKLKESTSTDLTIVGRLSNEEDDTSIAFAHVYFENSVNGTISNQNGYYELKIPLRDTAKHVVFSTVGYKSKKFSVSELLNKSNIQLQVVGQLLDEVVISAEGITADKIIEKVIHNIPFNYNIESFKSTYFCRTYERDTVNAIETSNEYIMQYHYPDGYANSKSKDYGILNKRNVLEDNGDMKFQTHASSYSVLAESYVFTFLLNKGGLKNYEFSIENRIKSDSSIIYEISYKCLNPQSSKAIGFRGGHSLSGRMYIDAKDFAVTDFSFDLTTVDKPSPFRLVFFNAKMKYKKMGDYYYLNYCNYYEATKVSTKERSAYIFRTSDFLLNDLTFDASPLVSNNKNLKQASYDPAFWENFNVVSDQKSDEGGRQWIGQSNDKINH